MQYVGQMFWEYCTLNVSSYIAWNEQCPFAWYPRLVSMYRQIIYENGFTAAGLCCLQNLKLEHFPDNWEQSRLQKIWLPSIKAIKKRTSAQLNNYISQTLFTDTTSDSSSSASSPNDNKLKFLQEENIFPIHTRVIVKLRIDT